LIVKTSAFADEAVENSAEDVAAVDELGSLWRGAAAMREQ
jgi:hypothetical protein